MTRTIEQLAEKQLSSIRPMYKSTEKPISVYDRDNMLEMYKAGANALLEIVIKYLDKVDVDNHDYEDLEDLYDWLCEMVKQLKGGIVMAKINNVEVGKFYVCTLETAKCYGLTKGKVYKAVFKEGIGITILNDYSTPLAINGFKDCFRPATEEEILAEQKLVEGVTNEPMEISPKFI